jgi:hypothetical protein
MAQIRAPDVSALHHRPAAHTRTVERGVERGDVVPTRAEHGMPVLARCGSEIAVHDEIVQLPEDQDVAKRGFGRCQLDRDQIVRAERGEHALSGDGEQRDPSATADQVDCGIELPDAEWGATFVHVR